MKDSISLSACSFAHRIERKELLIIDIQNGYIPIQFVRFQLFIEGTRIVNSPGLQFNSGRSSPHEIEPRRVGSERRDKGEMDEPAGIRE